MKLVGKIILWILGIMGWITLIEPFIYAELDHGSKAFYLILIITGILLAIYIFRKTGPRDKDLEKENQELKTEIQQLRQELEQAQAVQRAMEQAEKREKKD